MKTMNYGTMPTKDEFQTHWDNYMDGKAFYSITYGSSHQNDDCPYEYDYTCSLLWDELNRLTRMDTEESLSWVSDILGTLGFEWI